MLSLLKFKGIDGKEIYIYEEGKMNNFRVNFMTDFWRGSFQVEEPEVVG